MITYPECQALQPMPRRIHPYQPTHYLLFELDAEVFLHRLQVCHISQNGATKVDELGPTMPYQRSPACRVRFAGVIIQGPTPTLVLMGAAVKEQTRKQKLDKVRERYGIQDLGNRNASRAVTGTPRPLSPPRTSKALGPFERMHVVHPKTTNKDERPPTRRTDYDLLPKIRAFHYCVRIEECTLPLLCEVMAESFIAAREHVKRIPNLVECQAISAEDYVALLK